MEFNNIYIDPNINDYIFEQLKYEDMIIFLQINKFTLSRYSEAVKNKVFDFLNVDYRLYKQCFMRYKYDSLTIKTLGIQAIACLNNVVAHHNRYYDLRFTFELILNGLDIYDEDIISANEKSNVRFILKKMYGCKSFTRFETILNVNKEPSLCSLHSLFHPSVDYLKI